MNHIIEKKELEAFVPHRGKMFLLSRMTEKSYEPFSVTCETDITRDFIFYDEELGGIPNWCVFEIMAQAVSALTGIYNFEHGIPSKAGCILSVSGFRASKDVFLEGTTVKVCCLEDFRDEETKVYRYNCSLFSGADSDVPAVEASITVMQVENMDSIINA